MESRLIPIIIILILLAIAGGIFLPPAKEFGPIATPTVVGMPPVITNFYVTEVIDGDTIKVASSSGEQVVRLVGVDAPETKDPKQPIGCFGAEAATYLNNLLFHRYVRLEPDTIQTNQDKYGRLLRYVYLTDNILVNQEMVRLGYAKVYTEFQFKFSGFFKSLETEAKKSERGLWGKCKA
jgi:micrococcal nuclease